MVATISEYQTVNLRREMRSSSSTMSRKQASLVQRTVAYIKADCANRLSNCRYVNDTDNKSNEIAKFHRREIVASSLLGAGSFSQVYQIEGFRLSSHVSSDSLGKVQKEEREYIADEAEHGGRFVIKVLHRDLLKQPKKFHYAAVDLVQEASLLTRINHPNILKLKGAALHGMDSFAEDLHQGFFLVLDELDETLYSRLDRWKRIKEETGDNDSIHLSHKLDIALQLARALEYLHSNDLIFRDLKPDNVGFIGNTVKLFDFGLCRELPEEKPHQDKTFRMTKVGTKRYMAPEVYNKEGYNLKADVYGWSLIFHEILSLSLPYASYDAALHRLLVCQEGVRPPIDEENWSFDIQRLIRDSWSHNVQRRPSMAVVCQKLEDIIREEDRQQRQQVHSSRNIFDGPRDFLLSCATSFSHMTLSPSPSTDETYNLP